MFYIACRYIYSITDTRILAEELFILTLVIQFQTTTYWYRGELEGSSAAQFAALSS